MSEIQVGDTVKLKENSTVMINIGDTAIELPEVAIGTVVEHKISQYDTTIKRVKFPFPRLMPSKDVMYIHAPIDEENLLVKRNGKWE